jgi:hypothetical protein
MKDTKGNKVTDIRRIDTILKGHEKYINDLFRKYEQLKNWQDHYLKNLHN